jgi:hypothetical protein
MIVPTQNSDVTELFEKVAYLLRRAFGRKDVLERQRQHRLCGGSEEEFASFLQDRGVDLSRER